MWNRAIGCLVRGFVLLAWGTGAGVPRAAAGDPADDVAFEQVRLGDGAAAMALRAAIGRAAGRLAAPACQGLLSEFQDATGRPLQALLDESGKSSSQYIAGLFFYDGSEMPQCGTPSTLAFTRVGSRVVLVCPAQLRSQERHDATRVDVVIIHEILHTLGLGENPPSSQEISARVFSRCVANTSTRLISATRD